MTTTEVGALLAGALALGIILALLRRRQLKERYAALWLIVGLAMMLLGLFPGTLDAVGGWLGVADPPNLLFFVAILVLLVVVVQLSLELSRVEDRVRRLAEELALLRHDVDGGSADAGPRDAANGADR